MVELIYLAAAIPFFIIVAAVAVLATVRYAIAGDRLLVFILGVPIRKIPIPEITSVTYVPPGESGGWRLFHHGGTVIVQAGAGRTYALTPRDAEELAEDIKAAVMRVSGRAA